MRFKYFVIISIAVLALIGGYSIAKLEGVTSSNKQQIVQHSEDNCKLKLFALATGFEQQAQLHHNPREAAVLAGALRVVLSIPSAKSCVPEVRFALEHSRGHGHRKLNSITRLAPAVERELIRLAGSHPEGGRVGGGRPRSHHRSAPAPAPRHIPKVVITIPVPPPPRPGPSAPPPKSKGDGGNGQGKAKVETPPVKVPHEEKPVVTVPPVEVPPITVETPPVKLPCVQVGPVKANCTEEN